MVLPFTTVTRSHRCVDRIEDGTVVQCPSLARFEQHVKRSTMVFNRAPRSGGRSRTSGLDASSGDCAWDPRLWLPIATGGDE